MLTEVRFHKDIFWLVAAVFTLLLTAPQAFGQESKPTAQKVRLDINLGVYHIKDEEVQKTLGIKSIPIRKESYRLPSMKLPLLVVQELPQKEIKPRLVALAKGYADTDLSKAKLKDLNDIVTAQVDSKIFWLNKPSGAFAYFNKALKPGTYTLFDPCLLAKLALKKLLVRRKWPPIPPEPDPVSWDIIFLTQVMEAGIQGEEVKPKETRAAEYLVGFGRRYRGVPVVGSRLVARLGPDGELMGVQEIWRPIAAERGSVNLDAASFTRRLTTALRQQKVLQRDQSVEKNIKILSTAWGYIEGPVGNTQKMLVPGVLVNYRLRSEGVADLAAQIVIPMVDVDFPILGTPASFRAKAAAPQKTKGK